MVTKKGGRGEEGNLSKYLYGGGLAKGES